MTILSKRVEKSLVEIAIDGHLDTGTAPLLERKIKQLDGEDITEFVLDFSRLAYISSAGLRVLLQLQKTIKAEKKKFAIKNLTEAVREVFQMTGFIDLFVNDEKFVVIRKEESDLILLSLIGQMDISAISLLEKELIHLRDQYRMEEKVTLVGLDFERLSTLSASDCQALQQVLAKTAWAGRKMFIRNVSAQILDTLKAGGFQDMIEKSGT
jgi:anti-anti-sigma factor